MRPVVGRLALAAVLAGSLALSLPAVAFGGHSLRYVIFELKPPTEPEYLEDPCGAAVDSHGNLYVSDYYHDKIRIFSSGGGPITKISDVDPLDGPCGIAVDPTGRIYVNSYHEGVLTLTPSAYPPGGGTTYSPPATVIGGVNATGLALDPLSGNLLVDERTSVAEYETPIAPGAEPLRRIGTGALGDGYGPAVSGYAGTAGYVYVADAADSVVEVFDPATSLTEPVATIDGSETPLGRFNDLADAALAVDDANGHLYVVDNVDGPLYEHPRAGIEEFDATGTFVGEVLPPGWDGPVLVHGGPTGIAVDNTATATQSDLYVSSGNSEKSSLLAFGPTTSAPEALAAPTGGGAAAGTAADTATFVPRRLPPGGAGVKGASASAISQQGKLRVSVTGAMSPKALPRHGSGPVSVSVSGEVSTTDGSTPPRLARLTIEINRHGHLDLQGLPLCPLSRIQPASTQRALSSCRAALVGQGHFEAETSLSGGDPYPTEGRLLLFNATQGGRPVLFGHIYSTRPFTSSYVIPFRIGTNEQGTYGASLSADLASALGERSRLTGIEMTLSRRYTYQGKRHSFLSAGCPAPKGFPGASFPLTRASFAFSGGEKLSSTLTGSCRARG